MVLFRFCAAFISCARSFTRSFPDADEFAVAVLTEESFLLISRLPNQPFAVLLCSLSQVR